MRKTVLTLLALTLVVVLAACSRQSPTEVVVSAAASLSDALKEIQPAYEAQHKAVKLRYNFGSSGALQQQIEQGAPVDLFISAAAGPLDSLVKQNRVEQVRPLATNKIVLIRAAAGVAVVKSWDDLTADAVKRVAIGNPQHVPAGQYAKAVLEKLGTWPSVEKRLVLGEDARQVLNYVESGEVQAGIVYSTDAAASKKVTVVAEAPVGSHAPVLYPMAVLKDAKNAAQARAFADYLLSDEGKKVLSKHGFGPAQ